jgi:transposase
MTRSYLTEKDKLQIIELKAKKMSLIKISNKIKKNYGTVTAFYRRYKKRKTITNATSTGRPPKVTKRMRRNVVRAAKKCRTASVSQIRQDLNITEVTRRTINNIMLDVGLVSLKPTKKCKLTEPQRKKRLDWAKKHQNFTTEYWEEWIFSDESSYQLGYSAGQRVRRSRGEAMNPQCTTTSTKWSKKVFFWGAFCIRGVSDLVFIEGTMDSGVYIDVLKAGLLPMYRRLDIDKKKWIYMEDGDPKHRSAETRKWKEKNAINFLENWPPNSPDLNPIENLWGILKRRVGLRKPLDVETAKQYLTEEWVQFDPQDFLYKFIHSMPKRCQMVVQSKGYSIKY